MGAEDVRDGEEGDGEEWRDPSVAAWEEVAERPALKQSTAKSLDDLGFLMSATQMILREAEHEVPRASIAALAALATAGWPE